MEVLYLKHHTNKAEHERVLSAPLFTTSLKTLLLVITYSSMVLKNL